MNAEREKATPLSVVAAPYKVADPALVQEALAGARDELSTSGLLGPSGAFPQLWVEVLRVDEAGTGIAAITPDPATGEIPLARGAEVGVTGRGWVVVERGAIPAFDTGDIRRTQAFATPADIRTDAIRRATATRAAAREVGRAVSRSVLGEPIAAQEPM